MTFPRNSSQRDPIIIRPEEEIYDFLDSLSWRNRDYESVILDIIREEMGRRRTNRILNYVDDFIRELGGPRGLRRILYTRVGEIKYDEGSGIHSYPYVVCLFDYYEKAQSRNKGYVYRSIVVDERENGAYDLFHYNGAHRPSPYEHLMRIDDGRTLLCKAPSNYSRSLCKYAIETILRPINERREQGTVMVRFYNAVNVIKAYKNLPVRIRMRGAKPCRDPLTHR